jgi:pyruvate dehydrogenase E2 component (dihydrolipoamide acetyltransferase)
MADVAIAVATAGPAYAGPAVRKLAREFGVDLADVAGTGDGGRVQAQDLHRHVQQSMARAAVPATAPHATHFDEADVTDLEALRQQFNAHNPGGPEITMASFLIKAVAVTLRSFPNFNASLEGDELVLKRQFHIGFAADTPNDLQVAVISDVDRKGLREISAAVAQPTLQAGDGGCFSIASPGGQGFTPIINAPDVAMLGVARAAIKPVWNGQEFTPRLMLPLALSWDRRVIDGAEATGFLMHLSGVLGDFRQILL